MPIQSNKNGKGGEDMIQKLAAKKMVITGDYAAAYGALLADAEVVAAYPITPHFISSLTLGNVFNTILLNFLQISF